MFLYGVYDKIQEIFVQFFLAQTDAAAVRFILPQIVKSSPLVDFELHNCGLPNDFFSNVVDWNCYKFPETQAEALSPLELSEKQLEILRQKEIDNANYQQQLDNIKDKE